ncbi:MAG: hypothetical protein GF390_01955, partial [Candidatus Pacebacteria bacterium]|nr:hypothetical protein [Candidatus Paceibacterota bacterium]
LYLTRSVSAWLTLWLGLWWLTKHKLTRVKLRLHKLIIVLVLTPILIAQLAKIYPQQLGLTRRHMLNQAALKMWLAQPVFGVGFNQFTTQVEDYVVNNELVDFTQPAHHLGLLWLAETGLLGLLVLALTKSWKQPGLLILAPIIVLDHYLLTQQIGLLLLIIWLNWNPIITQPQSFKTTNHPY